MHWHLIECCSLVAKIPKEPKFMKKSKSGSKFSKSTYSYQMIYLNRKNLKVVFHITLNAMLLEEKIEMDVLLRNACLLLFPHCLHKGHICIKCMGSWSQIKSVHWIIWIIPFPVVRSCESCEGLPIWIATLYFLFIYTTILLCHCEN